MSGLAISDWTRIGWVGLTLIGIPLCAGLLPTLVSMIRDKKEGRVSPPLFGFVSGLTSGLEKKTNPDSQNRIVWLLLQLAFGLLSAIFFSLQLNLAVILFFAGFAWLCRILAQWEPQSANDANAVDSPVRSFLFYQPVIFLVCAGIGLMTGGLMLSALSDQPRWLVVELPFFWLSLLAVVYNLVGYCSQSAFSGRLKLIDRLAASYWLGTLLLLAGSFFGASLASSAVAALIVYLMICLVRQFRGRFYWRAMTAWNKGTLYYGCLINYCWIYVRYWL